MKFFYVLGVCALIGSVTLKAAADSESSESDSAEERGRCKCERKSCIGVIDSKMIGCLNTNSYLQCNNATCTALPCPTGQVWNNAKNACSECDTGRHVSANLQVCVCNQGTTLDSATQACVPCPSDSTQEADRCYCPATSIRDYATNACKLCPTGATLKDKKCVCTDTTLFFSQKDWTCNTCPGTLIPPPSKRTSKYSCRCTGANQTFYEKDAICYTCPTGTTADHDDCDCPLHTDLHFDFTTETCICKQGYALNASGMCKKTTLSPKK
jgi:hypothetical protein